jgi:hypothetical protein
MSAKRFEAFLARLYVDRDARTRFRTDPIAEAKNFGLSSTECKALENIDWIGLEMTGRSLAKKRELKRPRSWFSLLTERLVNFISVLSGRVRRYSERGTLERKT